MLQTILELDHARIALQSLLPYVSVTLAAPRSGQLGVALFALSRRGIATM
jgi:hypothetical protein